MQINNYSDKPFCYMCGRRIHKTKKKYEIVVDKRILYIHKLCKDKLNQKN